MNEHVIDCPCCKNKIRIQIDSSGTPTSFLLEENSISQTELVNNFGIELGIVEDKKEVN